METISLYKNFTEWVENLALEELNMEESGVVHMNEHLDPVLS